MILWDTLQKGFFGIMLLIDGAIYSLIGSAYRIFMAVAEARILSSSAYMEIANNIYIIIGVVMLFVLAYAILKAIIDPDQISKGKLSAPHILKKIVIAILGLALTPVFFDIMYNAQTLFLENDVIAKLFFRSTEKIDATEVNVGSTTIDIPETELDSTIKDVGGALTAASVWQAFFYPDGKSAEDIKVSAADLYLKSAGYGVAAVVAGVAGGIAIFGASNAWNPVGWVCLGIAGILGLIAATSYDGAEKLDEVTEGKDITLEQAYGIASSTGNFYIFYSFLDKIIDGDIHYMFLVSSIAGAFVLYVFISFSIDMGYRAAKLAYYQIIAPIPLILSVLPEFSENFNNYVKDVVRTFVEVFIRISVVYICIYIISHLTTFFSSTETLWGNKDISTIESVLALAALILGLVWFAKSAPDLIGEAFGMKSGTMKLGIKEKLAKGGLFSAGAVAYGGAKAGIQGFRRNWEKGAAPDEFGNKHRVAQILKAAGGGVGSAISGSSRSFASQYVGPGHKRAESLADLRATANKAAEDVSDARERREKLIREGKAGHPDAGNGEAMLRGVGADLGKRIDRWSTSSVDTSYEDGFMKTLGEVQDFKDKARAKTAKDKAVQTAQALYDDLQRQEIGDYDEHAYSRAVKAATAAVDSKFVHIAAADDASKGVKKGDYVDAAGNKSDKPVLIDPTKQADYTAARANAASSVNREEYRYSEEEKARATADLVDKRQRAKDFLEKTQDAAFMRLVNAGDDAAVTLYQNFVNDNLPQLQTYASERLDNGQTLGDFMSSRLHISLSDGKFDADASKTAHAGQHVAFRDGDGMQHIYRLEADGNYSEMIWDQGSKAFVAGAKRSAAKMAEEVSSMTMAKFDDVSESAIQASLINGVKIGTKTIAEHVADDMATWDAANPTATQAQRDAQRTIIVDGYKTSTEFTTAVADSKAKSTELQGTVTDVAGQAKTTKAKFAQNENYRNKLNRKRAQQKK